MGSSFGSTREWATLTEAQRGVGSLGAFKRGSEALFLAGYREFVCRAQGCGVRSRDGRVLV